MDGETRPLPGVRKLVVLRANGIGDYVFSLPALDALRSAYPQAQITLLGLEWHSRFIPTRPGPVDRVVVVPRSRGINGSIRGDEPIDEDPQEIETFFQAQAQEGYDLAIQLHGGGLHSNPFVRRLGARLTVGLKSPDAQPLDRWVPYLYFQPEILRFLEVVSLVGAHPASIVPLLPVTDEDLRESRERIPEQGRPLVMIHPGAGDPRRRWAPEKFARVADAFRHSGYQVVITGTARERELVDAVLDRMETDALDACSRLSLGGLVGLLARSDLVVANDSGPLHLAEAVGAPTVGIYWCGNLINAEPITRSRHRPLISWRLDCPICGRDTIYADCGHAVSFVDNVQVDEVLSSGFDLLRCNTRDCDVSFREE